MARAVRAERPATFGDALRIREFRAIFFAQMLSELGDQLARVALSVLVYRASNSPLLTALAYALTFLPGAVSGPLLGPIADRGSRRRVMVWSDIIRIVLVGLMAVPAVGLGALFLLLAAATLLQGPFDAARASVLPDLLPGDLYVAGQSLVRLLNQMAQVLGFAFGGLILTVLSPRTALGVDALTFLFSAVLLQLFMREHRVASDIQRTSFSREIREGAQIVFRNPMLRGLVLLAWVATAFTVVPEALAAPYAHSLHGGAPATGILLAAAPLGTVVGVIAISRLSPSLRPKLIRPLALASCLPLMVCALNPGLAVVVCALVISGLAMSFNVPANQAFVQALPPSARGRAFGLASGGFFVGQGLLLLVGGILADWLAPHLVVALVGAIGTGLLLVMAGFTSQAGPGAVVKDDHFMRLDHPVG